MNSAMATTTTWMVTISRLVLALVMAFLLGSLLVQSVDATVFTRVTKHQSKSDWIRAERSMCVEGTPGGTFSETTLPSGNTKTSCTGGDHTRTCVVTDKVADCETRYDQTAPESSVPDDISAPPTEGVYDEPARSVQDEVSAPPSNNTYEDPAGGNVAADGDAVVESSGFAEQPEYPALIAAETIPPDLALEAGAAPASDGVASEPTPVIAE
jgi:hypothetical protein